jgi:hypothetical protein
MINRSAHIITLFLLRAKALRTTFARRTKVLLLGVLLVLFSHQVHSCIRSAHDSFTCIVHPRTKVLVCPRTILCVSLTDLDVS